MIASTPVKLKNTILSLPHPAGHRHHVTQGNILLAGHNKEELDTLSAYLKDKYELFAARNGNGVMKMIEVHSIHLIIASTEPGETDGNKLCAQLKSSELYSHIPVILLISKDPALSRLNSLESGADAYIEKPFCRELINAQVNNVMANRARIKHYFAHTIYAYMDMPAMSKTKEAFVNRLNQCISANLSNMYFDVGGLAKYMNMSRPTLYRKVKCISGLTPNELINAARLKRAAELILTADHKIFEIAKMVGFNSRSNFGKAFFKEFKLTPIGYQQLKSA